MRLRDVRDGTSNTLLAGEIENAANESIFGGRQPWWIAGQGQRSSTSACACWPINGQAHLATGDTYYRAFGSYHEGGAFFLFADGQVRFLSENVDTNAFRALATRANNELIDDEDF